MKNRDVTNMIFTLNSLLVQYCTVKRILWILSNARTCEDYDVMAIGGNGTAVYLANAIDLHCYLSRKYTRERLPLAASGEKRYACQMVPAFCRSAVIHAVP